MVSGSKHIHAPHMVKISAILHDTHLLVEPTDFRFVQSDVHFAAASKRNFYFFKIKIYNCQIPKL